jgi:ATP-dependent HslUV protease, peptidase subunit HslV
MRVGLRHGRGFMSTIVVAQKNGVACIGADTLSSLGSLRQKAEHLVNKTKVTKIGDTFIGLTGTSASLVVWNSYFANPERPRDFSSCQAIFETLRYAHHVLKVEYFMSAGPDKDDEYETTQFYGLAANPQGIFAIYSYRSAQQFTRFWSAGSGRDYALGAMQSVYDKAKTAEEIVRAGLEASAEFDSSTSGPFEIFNLPLASAAKPKAKRATKR